MRNLYFRVGQEDLPLFVTAVAIQGSTGGNLSEVLSGLASLVRDRSALRGQVDTLTAEPKFAGRVLAMLPVIAFFAFSYLNKDMMIPMTTTRTGQYILLYAGLSIAAGYFVMMKIADIEL